MAEPPLDEHGLPEGYSFRPQWEVTPRQVHAMRTRGERVVVVDCRTPAEAQTASLGADKLVPVQELEQRLEELLPYREEKLVVHCHHGGRSLQMASMLRQQGFADVMSMAGGIDLWSRDVDPSVPRY